MLSKSGTFFGHTHSFDFLCSRENISHSIEYLHATELSNSDENIYVLLFKIFISPRYNVLFGIQRVKKLNKKCFFISHKQIQRQSSWMNNHEEKFAIYNIIWIWNKNNITKAFQTYSAFFTLPIYVYKRGITRTLAISSEWVLRQRRVSKLLLFHSRFIVLFV